MALSFVPTNTDTTMLEAQSQSGTVLKSLYGVGSGSGEGLRRKVPVDNTESCINSLEEDLQKVVGDAVSKLQLVEENEKDHFCQLCLENVDACDCPYLKGYPSDQGGPTYDICCSDCGARVCKHPSKYGEDWQGHVVTSYRFHCVNKGEQWDAKDDFVSDFESESESEFLCQYPNAVG